ncbi:hypothetical protein CPB86DRAFT_473655 [Serendipita vermifera]|nr:hypothetical protein CPB86DRAFT_473655 [Serendipita vermifera]
MRAQMEYCKRNRLAIIQNIKDVKKHLQDLENWKANSEKMIAVLKWSLSPMRRLPDETLIEIFEICILQYESDPWHLAHVCRRFRFVAFQAHRIWARIEIVEQRDGLKRNHRGWERCYKVRHLLSAFKRSTNASLDIKISYLSVQMADALAEERERWAHLTWHVWRPNFSTEAMSILFDLVDTETTLKSVHLRSISHALVAEWVEAVEPELLDLSHCFLEPFTLLTIWDNLRCLHINDSENKTGARASVVAFLQLVNTQLEDLELFNLDFDKSDLPKVVEFPRLKHLNLSWVDRWWKISAPNITTLKLIPITSAPLTRFFNYPCLVDLYYDACNIPLPFDLICAPQLASLTLHYPAIGKPGLNFVWCTPSYELSDITPRKIVIQGLPRSSKKIYWKDLLESLRPHRRLEALHLHGLRLPPVFYKWFLKSHAQDGRILCPRLRELVVDMGFSRAQRDIDYYDRVFEELEEQRKHTVVPLEKLSVEWPVPSKLGTTDYADNAENTETEEESSA